MRSLLAMLLCVSCTKAPPPPPPPVHQVVVVVPPARTPCFDGPRVSDAHRVVLSHPFTADGAPDTRFTVYAPEADGLVAGTTFRMGRATEAVIRFTPDGQLGAVAQTDGTIGLFRLHDDGQVDVLQTGFGQGELYAHDVVWDTPNQRLLVLDANWANNGGGVYEVRLNCANGRLDRPRRLLASRQASGLVLRDDAPAWLVATHIEGTHDLTDVHTVHLDRGRVHHSARQLDDRAMRSAVQPVGDEWLVVADNSAFSGIPHRVAFSRMTDDGIAATQVLEIEDPFDVVASPYGNAVLVSSGIRNAVLPIVLDGDQWSTGDAVARPRLPGRMVALVDGPQQGRVFLAENNGVRQLQFLEDGTVQDLGQTSVGTGQAAITGSIGVQP